MAWAELRAARARVGSTRVTGLLLQGDLSALEGGFFELSEGLGPCPDGVFSQRGELSPTSGTSLSLQL